MKSALEPMSSAAKARNVPTLAMIQQMFWTRKEVLVPSDMATARMTISANPRPKVHNCPAVLVPLTTLPALVRPLLLVTAPRTARLGPRASTANDLAQKAAPISAETEAEKLLNMATDGCRMRLIQT